MKLLIAGASGFVGEQITTDALARGHEVMAIVHSNKHASANAIPVACDVTSIASVESATKNLRVDAVIYLPGLLREFPSKGVTFQGVHVDGVRNLLKASAQMGTTRWLQMSALGTSPNAATSYFRTKWQAEQLVRASELDWTIVRPSVIFPVTPTTKLNFIGELAGVIRHAPVLPIFGDGDYRMQPVALTDVSRVFLDSLEKSEAITQTFELGGPEKLRYEVILKLIASALHKRRPAIHIPFGIVTFVASLFDRFPFFPLTRDQLTMLKNENIVHDIENEKRTSEVFGAPDEKLETALSNILS